MRRSTISCGQPLRGEASVPGDKSISHRALLLGALGNGTTHVSGYLPSGDCRATLSCIQALGVEVEIHDSTSLSVHGRGLHGLRGSSSPLHCARSGTTMRLIAGILAGQPFSSNLTGDPQLLRRPMRRIVDPLREMGAEITDTGGYAPLTIRSASLHGHSHTLKVASAQVKSAILLAGLFAGGPTVVQQPGPARDHTERMLAAMGADIEITGLSVRLHPAEQLVPLTLSIPGDISSAAFLLVASILVPNSELTIRGVGANPTRTGLLDVLQGMGADFVLHNRREIGNEPVVDITARAGQLCGVEVAEDTVVRMIDEFPVFAVAATQAQGTTTVRDAQELRVKETDRIAAVTSELRKMGADITPLPDGFEIKGPTPLSGATVESHGDHRLAMALTVAGLVAKGETHVDDADCISDSFPGFEALLEHIQAR